MESWCEVCLSGFQLNEVTPFFDGNLMYGPNKAWTDAIRLFKDGLLEATNDSTDPSALDRDRYFPAINDIRLPFANPSPPRDHVLKPIRRFYSKNCVTYLLRPYLFLLYVTTEFDLNFVSNFCWYDLIAKPLTVQTHAGLGDWNDIWLQRQPPNHPWNFPTWNFCGAG